MSFKLRRPSQRQEKYRNYPLPHIHTTNENPGHLSPLLQKEKLFPFNWPTDKIHLHLSFSIQSPASEANETTRPGEKGPVSVRRPEEADDAKWGPCCVNWDSFAG